MIATPGSILLYTICADLSIHLTNRETDRAYRQILSHGSGGQQRLHTALVRAAVRPGSPEDAAPSAGVRSGAKKEWTVRQNIFILSTDSAFCGLMKYEISVKIEIQSRKDRADKSTTDFPDDPETAPLF